MRIAYFIAEKTQAQLTLECLQELGLGYAFDRKPMVQQLETGKGPDGRSGCVVSRSGPPVGYRPEHQKVEPFVGADGVWILMDKQNPPTPEEMVRDDWKNSAHQPGESDLLVIDSHDLHVSGQAWPVPVARGWSLASPDSNITWSRTLPKSVRYVANAKENGRPGFVTGDVIDMYLPLERIAEQVHAEYPNNSLPDDYMEMCANVMGLPYYIGPQELAMMGLIDSRPITAAKLLWLLIDEPGLFDLIKKKWNSQTKAQPLETRPDPWLRPNIR